MRIFIQLLILLVFGLLLFFAGLWFGSRYPELFTAPAAENVPSGTAQPTNAQTGTATPPAAAVSTPTLPEQGQLPPDNHACPTAFALEPLPTAIPAAIYNDGLVSDWQDWSWGVNRNLGNASPVQSGSASIAVAYTEAWGGFYLHTDSAINASGYSHLRFWAHGGSNGGQKMVVVINQNTNSTVELTLEAGWVEIQLPLTRFGAPAWISDIFWQEGAGSPQETFFLDGIALVAGEPVYPPTPTPCGPFPTGTPVVSMDALRLQVDVSAEQRPISPYIYGINFASEELAEAIQLPVRRFGGNATTRYSWKSDVSNRASDWFFENYPNENSSVAALPNGSASDSAIEQDRRTGSQTIMTIPMIGWTPKDREIRCGFSVSKYGAQQATDPWQPDCGNGVRANGSNITGNDPTDTSIAIDPAFVQEWIAHLHSRFGSAADGGVLFYNLDNEPMLWHETHRDVHPQMVGYDEIRDRTFQYAAAVKAADPAAQTLGPVLWGWTAYFYSALDSRSGGEWWKLPLDRISHANMPFVEWYLQQMQEYEKANGVRILDYLDLHYYPQGQGVALSGAGDSETQALRLRSTRSLWDSGYQDESWIGEPVRLIPRMRAWVEQFYPGTKLAITEYNWGALDHINGALAQADVLGIFGREGLDLATLWAPPEVDDPGGFAFRMYRNYDGAGGQFGDTSVQAGSANQDALSIYAATRATDGALTLMIINKTLNSQVGTVALDNFPAASQAQVYRYSQSDLQAIVRQVDQGIDGGAFTAEFPASSITLIVISRQ
jgi:hypothetical protein